MQSLCAGQPFRNSSTPSPATRNAKAIRRYNRRSLSRSILTQKKRSSAECRQVGAVSRTTSNQLSRITSDIYRRSPLSPRLGIAGPAKPVKGEPLPAPTKETLAPSVSEFTLFGVKDELPVDCRTLDHQRGGCRRPPSAPCCAPPHTVRSLPWSRSNTSNARDGSYL